MQDAHPIIAKEGWLYIFLIILLSLVVSLTSGFIFSIPLWLLAIFVVQFFRDPKRTPPQEKNSVVAPADGRVITIEHAYDPYAERQALKISVFMNVFNVHSNRVPVEGTVVHSVYFSGKFFNAAWDKASLDNERQAIVLQTAEGQHVSSVQIAGLIARRILCYAKVNDHLHCGQRYGFIRFGSRVDVFLPLTASPRVSLGEKVCGGETLLALL